MILYYACNFLVIPSFILLSDIIFSTAHKAKGLEFDTVRVTDDYLPGTDLGMSIREYILWSNIQYQALFDLVNKSRSVSSD